MVGQLNAAPSASSGAGFNLQVGTAPTSPANGNLWITSSGFFAQVGGSTVQLNGGSPGGSSGSLQFNNSGSLGGVGPTANSIAYYNPSATLALGTQGNLTTASSLSGATAPIFISSGAVQQAALAGLAGGTGINLSLGGSTLTISASGVPLSALATTSSAGAVAYDTGSGWTSLAGNNSGTLCFGENSSGVPLWTNCGGSGTVVSGNAGQLAYYSITGTSVSGTNVGTGVLTALGNSIGAASGLIQIIPTIEWYVCGTGSDSNTGQSSGSPRELWRLSIRRI